jgi:hypothetical protein
MWVKLASINGATSQPKQCTTVIGTMDTALQTIAAEQAKMGSLSTAELLSSKPEQSFRYD